MFIRQRPTCHALLKLTRSHGDLHGLEVNPKSIPNYCVALFPAGSLSGADAVVKQWGRPALIRGFGQKGNLVDFRSLVVGLKNNRTCESSTWVVLVYGRVFPKPALNLFKSLNRELNLRLQDCSVVYTKSVTFQSVSPYPQATTKSPSPLSISSRFLPLSASAAAAAAAVLYSHWPSQEPDLTLQQRH